MAALIATGVLSMVAQIVVLRELSVASYGVELVAILALGSWLLGSAIGAAADRRIARAPRPWPVAALFVVLGASAILTVVVIRASRTAWGGTPGAYLPFDRQLATVALATWPIAAICGLCFQWSARRAIAAGRTLAGAYALESLGALAGGAAATASLRCGASTLVLAVACAAIGLLSAALVGQGRRTIRGFVGITALVTAAVAASPLVAPVDERLSRWNHPAWLAGADTVYARVTVDGSPGDVAVFVNDALAFADGDVGPEVLADLTLLQHPRPRRVLLLGGALDGLAAEALAHRPDTLVVAELDAAEVRVTLPHVAAATRSALAGGRVTLVLDDPRRLVERGPPEDAILIGMPEPSSGAANRYYTREFFDACRRRLAPGGVVGLRLNAAENYWTPAERTRVASIHASLAAVFAHVRLLPAPDVLVFVASQAALPDAEIVIARLLERDLRPRMVTREFVRYVYDNDRRADAARAVRSSAAAPNTDARPVAFRAALVAWLGRFWPGVATLDPEQVSPSPWALLAAIAALFVGVRVVAGRARPSVARALLVAMAGLVGMMLEAVVILHYQVTRGVLYADLGLLLTAFMAGLAVGAFLAARRAAHPQRPMVIAALAVLAAAGAAVGVSVDAGVGGGLMAAAAVLGLTGAAAGVVFGCAAGGSAERQRDLVAPLYAADLAGGSVGALIAGLVLVPGVGLAVTAWLCALVALVSLLLV